MWIYSVNFVFCQYHSKRHSSFWEVRMRILFYWWFLIYYLSVMFGSPSGRNGIYSETCLWGHLATDQPIHRFVLKMSLSKTGTSIKWVIWKSPIGAHPREVLLYMYIEFLAHLKDTKNRSIYMWSVWNIPRKEQCQCHYITPSECKYLERLILDI